MTKSEAGRLGQKVLREKMGDDYSKHMSELGKKGFQAVIIALADRQNLSPDIGYNQFRNLLRNLKNGKEPR